MTSMARLQPALQYVDFTRHEELANAAGSQDMDKHVLRINHGTPKPDAPQFTGLASPQKWPIGDRATELPKIYRLGVPIKA